MSDSAIEFFLNKNSIVYEVSVDLKKKTWIHRGGVADYFITPSSVKELESVCRFLYNNNIVFKIFGHTSNIYVRNGTNFHVVVSIVKCSSFSVINNEILCDPGVSVMNLSKKMIGSGIRGFEYLTCLPGTVSAALINNSSCKENSISSLLIRARLLKPDGTIVTLTSSDFSFKYRTSSIKQKEIPGCIISVVLRADYFDPKELKRIAVANEEDRKRYLEGNACNLGCTFDNPFCLGRMDLKYRIASRMVRLIGRTLFLSEDKIDERVKCVLCKMSKCEKAIPYISVKNPIIYMWKDMGADDAFEDYCRFMKTVYKTDKLEIEVL